MNETPETDAAEQYVCTYEDKWESHRNHMVDAEFSRRLERERGELRTKVADLESLNRMVGHAADANEKDAMQAHDRISELMKERDELREALQAAMLECDHLILRWPSNPYEWQIGVSKIQEKLRAILAGGRVT